MSFYFNFFIFLTKRKQTALSLKKTMLSLKNKPFYVEDSSRKAYLKMVIFINIVLEISYNSDK